MLAILWFGFVLVALSAGDIIFTKVGQTVTLDCGVSAFRRQLSWSHSQSGSIYDDTGRTVPRKGLSKIAKRSKVRTMNLEISGVTEDDAGKLTCTADGNRHEHTLLVVSASVSPSAVVQRGQEATLECRIKYLNPGPTVSWKRPNGSPYGESPTVHLKAVADSDIGTWQYTITYSRKNFTGYLDIKLEVTTPATTTSSDSKSAKDTHKPSGKDPGAGRQPGDAALLGLSWWVWLVIGVGCLVVILLVVLIIVLCKRVRARKRKFLRMKNSAQPLKPKKYCQCDRQAAAAKPQQGRRREKPSALPLQPC
ncbi:CD4-2 molecule, tandem duplicate 1 [Stegastes partitus]|uniref:Uncharacterized LOC103367550 n=1 Tax=Stegastes partitus TaxID=144197 RepID=A0A3B5ASY1_9TELE|nr:PREDICTED: uncharacterized protein LOC103367550 [Stegastes partitus]